MDKEVLQDMTQFWIDLLTNPAKNRGGSFRVERWKSISSFPLLQLNSCYPLKLSQCHFCHLQSSQSFHSQYTNFLKRRDLSDMIFQVNVYKKKRSIKYSYKSGRKTEQPSERKRVNIGDHTDGVCFQLHCQVPRQPTSCLSATLYPKGQDFVLLLVLYKWSAHLVHFLSTFVLSNSFQIFPHNFFDFLDDQDKET